tara:strand:- start:516 stop:1043 length:528 start_codon:yes stop_codon:yes gene_type:complete
MSASELVEKSFVLDLIATHDKPLFKSVPASGPRGDQPASEFLKRYMNKGVEELWETQRKLQAFGREPNPDDAPYRQPPQPGDPDYTPPPPLPKPKPASYTTEDPNLRIRKGGIGKADDTDPDMRFRMPVVEDQGYPIDPNMQVGDPHNYKNNFYKEHPKEHLDQLPLDWDKQILI